jgi:hypothetical protein
MTKLWTLSSLLAITACSACGARTGDLMILDEPSVDAGATLDAHVLDASLPPPTVDAGAPSLCSGKSCDDHLACTIDRCNEATGQCDHQHDDSSCPAGFLCTATGCEAVAYANTETTIFEVTLPSGAERVLATTQLTVYDIALANDGLLYGVNNTQDFTIDRSTGTTHVIDVYNGGIFDALEAAADGTLFAAGPTSVVRLVRNSKGLDATLIVNYPPPSTSSGDLALVAGELYGTTTDDFGAAMPDNLFHIDVVHRTVTKVGSIGFRCVRGLAAFGAALFGFTCEGRVLEIDVRSGAATELHRNSSNYAGAAAR